MLKPREPEHKSLIERAHDYLERSFLAGRTFTGPEDFNAQLQSWIVLVNARVRRARCAGRGQPCGSLLGDGSGCRVAIPVALR